MPSSAIRTQVRQAELFGALAVAEIEHANCTELHDIYSNEMSTAVVDYSGRSDEIMDRAVERGEELHCEPAIAPAVD